MTGEPGAPPPDEPSPPRPRRSRWVRPLAIGLAGALIGIAAFVIVDPSGSNDSAAEPSASTATTTTTEPPAHSAEVYKTILPSLVFVSTETPNGTGIGSGVVVNTDGNIMTAYHVVDDAISIKVTFADGTESAARILNADPAHDIAVLESDTGPKVIVPAVLGGAAQVGDEAFPAGNPLGFNGSITAGVISGLNRNIESADGPTLEGLIQFDAAVNPGSSGGPLLNRNGHVIGIVTALANPTDQAFFVGIGFAVPISTASGAAGGPPQ